MNINEILDRINDAAKNNQEINFQNNNVVIVKDPEKGIFMVNDNA